MPSPKPPYPAAFRQQMVEWVRAGRGVTELAREFGCNASSIHHWVNSEQRTRTVRIRGVTTSIRLENMAWDILAEMGEVEGCTSNHLLVTFHDEIMAHRGEVPNFASLLRVTCMRYLRRQLTAAERQRPTEALARVVPLAARASR